MTAQDVRSLRKMTYQQVQSEERSSHIRNLLAKGVGFREEEEFHRKEGEKLKGGREFDQRKKIVKLAMQEKLRDNYKFLGRLLRQKAKVTSKIGRAWGNNSNAFRTLKRNIGNGARVVRKKAREKFKKKEKFLVNKYGGNNGVKTADLSDEDKLKFGEAKIFQRDQVWAREEAVEPSIVCGEGVELIVDDDELELLRLGPKFNVLARLNEEAFECELEQMLMKVKWEMMSNEDKVRKRQTCDVAIDLVIDEEQKLECEEHVEMLEAKTRMVYDVERNKFDYSKRRTTDLKNNARVVFPRTGDFQCEAKLEVLRLEAMQVFRDYLREKCDKRGGQDSNLTKTEANGLKKLKKRTEEGSIVVLPTDKTGNFAIMDRTSYETAGLSHVRGDIEVGWNELKAAQRELNGHAAMLIKVFKIGNDWNHGSRVRETMMGESLEVCPVHLLYKDHKGWSRDKGGIPPTRHVAGGNRGMNLHMSEMVSDILEPMVGRVTGGREIISTEDGLANMEDISSNLSGWTKYSWWEGVRLEKLEACGTCDSSEEYEWNEEKPDLCKCVLEGNTWSMDMVGVVEPSSQEEGNTGLSVEGETYKESTSQGGISYSNVGPSIQEGNTGLSVEGETDKESTSQGGKIRCTHGYMKKLRRLQWERDTDWDEEDQERIVMSTESLEEDLQDYEVPMVVVGSDVVSLYPNLDVEKVVIRIEEEAKRTDIQFENVDYLEATRYLALNWSHEQCRKSPLRRVLPWRRKNRGVRPGITGEGPRGKERGDQEQWEFPRIVLTEEEKRGIIAAVIRVATEAMFQKHYYSFGGKTFHQQGGGPIGLRGTCAVARLIMQIFDRKWEELLGSLNVRTHGVIRYMDDARTFLPPFKAGWRWSEGAIRYCKKWESEDRDKSGLERTREILAGTMGGIEDFLKFTTETEEDFEDGWLPTLDTAIRISEDNQILFKYWEKPTSSNRTIQMRTALGENQKIQILTQEMIRRLGNTMEGLEDGLYCRIVDDFSQKLYNSGYGEEQIRRIIVAGIRGWGGKIARCKAEGRRVRRTAKDSLGRRTKTKLLGKSTWFKKQGGDKKDWYGAKVRGEGRKGKKDEEQTPTSTAPSSVLFLEQTPGGELASRLKDLFRRLEKTVGFGVRVVERSGRSLQSMFPLNKLWEGASCGREVDCVTCYQGAEWLPDCTKQSVLYENVCATCVPSAGSKKDMKEEDLNTSQPAVYVGETSRSLAERTREHWASYRGRKEDSHILKHQQIAHNDSSPNFIMRMVGTYKTALGRQVGEAVRIRRRGGATGILNSKTEYSRCHIPRLQVEKEEETQKREQEIIREEERRNKDREEEQLQWEQKKAGERRTERRELFQRDKPTISGSNKRLEEDQNSMKGARRKRRKFQLLEEEWGEKMVPTNREPPSSPPNTKVIEGGGMIVTNHPDRDILLRMRAATQQQITLFTQNKVQARQDSKLSRALSVATEREGDISIAEDITFDGIKEQDTGTSRNMEMEQDDPVSQGTMLVEDELSLRNNTATETKQTVMPSSVEIVENTAAEKAGIQGEGIALPGNIVTQFTTHRDGVSADEAQIVNSEAAISNVNSMEGDTGVKCSFYRGVCRLHKIMGTKNTVTKKSWVKKKYGYGYSTTKKVIWSCNVLVENPGDTSNASTDVLRQMPVDKGSRQRGSEVFDMKGSEVLEFNQSEDVLKGLARQRLPD